MGTGQKVAVAGLVVLIGAVVVYYATQEPADPGDGNVALDTNAQLPPPTPQDTTNTDPSLTQGQAGGNVDLSAVEELLNLTEPADPVDEQPVDTTDDEPIDTLVQTTETTQTTDDEPAGPGDDEPVDEPGDGVVTTGTVDDDPIQQLTDEELARTGEDNSTIRINTDEDPQGDAGEDSTDDLERYTVVENDSLWVIARKTLGSGAKWELIAKANPLIDPMKIKPGDVLIIPKLQPEVGPIAEKTDRDPLGLGFNQDQKVIDVLDGDSLWKIAAREYGDGTKWRLIYTANKTRMKNENDVRPGQKLVIPPLPRE